MLMIAGIVVWLVLVHLLMGRVGRGSFERTGIGCYLCIHVLTSRVCFSEVRKRFGPEKLFVKI